MAARSSSGVTARRLCGATPTTASGRPATARRLAAIRSANPSRSLMNRRWPWLAHATVLAKHELKDPVLARQYAVALQRHTTTPDAPVWVKQMEPFILEDMNELEAAKVLIGGLIASGQVKDERDLRLLQRRLKLLEERIAAERARKP